MPFVEYCFAKYQNAYDGGNIPEAKKWLDNLNIIADTYPPVVEANKRMKAENDTTDK